jgi:hypothetical protein
LKLLGDAEHEAEDRNLPSSMPNTMWPLEALNDSCRLANIDWSYLMLRAH